MRSSKLESTTQKMMAKYGVGLRFHAIKYIEIIYFLVIFLKFIINLRALLLMFVEKHQFDVIVSYYKQYMIIACLIGLLAHYLHRLLEYVDFHYFFCQHKLLGYVDQCGFQMIMNFPFTKFKVSL